jgi:hypothetical protein
MSMKSFATLAALLFSIQATLCGLRGFGIVELLHAQLASTRTELASAEPLHNSSSSAEPLHNDVPAHCAGRGDSSTPAESSGAPDEAPCRSHCQLYAQGIPSDASHSLSAPVAMHCASAVCELGKPPARALQLPSAVRAPPLARDLPILHASLLI